MANKKKYDWPVMLLIAVVALGVGYFLGRMDPKHTVANTGAPGAGHENSNPAAVVPTAHAPSAPSASSAPSAPSGASSAATSPTTDRSVSPEDLAAQMKVPAKIESEQGDFTLVAVVEGEEANQSLHRSLQVVNVQRLQLSKLAQQYDKTPVTLTQQRELIAGQINEARKTLEQNLKFMAQNYAYVLSNNYLLVPHQATLSLIEGVGKEQKKKLVYTFKDAGSYELFQEKNQSYVNLKNTQLQEHQAGQPASEKPKPGDPPKSPAPLPLTPEMVKIQSEMVERYQYDPEKNYAVDFQKTALYARAATK